MGALLAQVASAAGTAPPQTPPSGHVATSAVGQVGQRQVADETTPMGRIDSRIPSRIPSRLHNRIDRYYDPKADTTTPFQIAADRATDSPRPPR